MSNLRELADECENKAQEIFYESSPILINILIRASVELRAQADAVDKVREGLSDEECLRLFNGYCSEIIDFADCEWNVLYFGDATLFARAIAAHYAPILAEVEQLRAENAELCKDLATAFVSEAIRKRASDIAANIENNNSIISLLKGGKK